MAPIHGAALLMYCCVSCMHTHRLHHCKYIKTHKQTIYTYTQTHTCTITKIQSKMHKRTVSTHICSHSLNLPITRVKSLLVSKQQFNTFHSLAESISIIVAIATASQSMWIIFRLRTYICFSHVQLPLCAKTPSVARQIL